MIREHQVMHSSSPPLVLGYVPLPPAEEVSACSDDGTLQWAQAHSTLLSTLITWGAGGGGTARQA
jgi:hypothetical protein